VNSSPTIWVKANVEARSRAALLYRLFSFGGQGGREPGEIGEGGMERRWVRRWVGEEGMRNGMFHIDANGATGEDSRCSHTVQRRKQPLWRKWSHGLGMGISLPNLRKSFRNYSGEKGSVRKGRKDLR
jgi:hypothetical protein